MTTPPIRCAETRADAEACADILNAWIDATDWMPRVHTCEDVRAHYRDWVLSNRELHVAGDPPLGFMALDTSEGYVTALYLSETGQGLGKHFLDLAKTGRDALRLWTFQANARARAFYAREGFAEERRTDGDNEENLPDVLLRWEAA